MVEASHTFMYRAEFIQWSAAGQPVIDRKLVYAQYSAAHLGRTCGIQCFGTFWKRWARCHYIIKEDYPFPMKRTTESESITYIFYPVAIWVSAFLAWIILYAFHILLDIAKRKASGNLIWYAIKLFFGFRWSAIRNAAYRIGFSYCFDLAGFSFENPEE